MCQKITITFSNRAISAIYSVIPHSESKVSVMRRNIIFMATFLSVLLPATVQLNRLTLTQICLQTLLQTFFFFFWNNYDHFIAVFILVCLKRSFFSLVLQAFDVYLFLCLILSHSDIYMMRSAFLCIKWHIHFHYDDFEN